MATNAFSTTAPKETSLILASSPEFAQTMSSREIAALLCKRHDHVMRDIRAMLLQLHGGNDLPKFGGVYRGSNGESRPCFNLPKRETLILISGYNVAMRAQIIDRWEELEARAVQADRQLLSSHSDEINRLKCTNSELTEKAIARELEDFTEAKTSKLKAPSVEKMIGLSLNAILPTLQQQAHAWLFRNYGVRVQSAVKRSI